jgi:hypothetical protein
METSFRFVPYLPRIALPIRPIPPTHRMHPIRNWILGEARTALLQDHGRSHDREVGGMRGMGGMGGMGGMRGMGVIGGMGGMRGIGGMGGMGGMGEFHQGFERRVRFSCRALARQWEDACPDRL